eukprot:595396-Pleurochrysis_carterae.AAC.2
MEGHNSEPLDVKLPHWHRVSGDRWPAQHFPDQQGEGMEGQTAVQRAAPRGGAHRRHVSAYQSMHRYAMYKMVSLSCLLSSPIYTLASPRASAS